MANRFFPSLCILFFVSSAVAGPVKSLLEMRQDNIVMQRYDLSCGAASLATLLRYQHDVEVTERAVAEAMLSRDVYRDNPEMVLNNQGFSLLDLKLYTESKGFSGTGYGSLEFENLENFAPLLIPVNINGYNHFLVYKGSAFGRVSLADPAWGNRIMTVDRFKEVWIDFPQLGRVGFTVRNRNTELSDAGMLKLKLSDFALVH